MDDSGGRAMALRQKAFEAEAVAAIEAMYPNGAYRIGNGPDAFLVDKPGLDKAILDCSEACLREIKNFEKPPHDNGLRQ